MRCAHFGSANLIITEGSGTRRGCFKIGVSIAWSCGIKVDDCLVAKRYVGLRRDDLMLLPPDVREWLPVDHWVWLLLDVVEQLDTSALHRRAKLGGAGRCPYDPDMLLAVLFYAYLGGLRSSRKIEQRCREDVAFMVLSGLCYPDHVTLARFRKAGDAVMDDLFDQVLALCCKAGMGNLEHVAIDGTKIAADAARSRSRDADGLRGAGRRWLDEAATVDGDEDVRFGAGRRGDELPEELRDPARRRQVVAELIGQADADPDRRRGRRRGRKARDAERALALADELQAEAQARAEDCLQQPEARVAKLEGALAKIRGEVQARADDRARREAEAAEQGRSIGGTRPVPVDEHVHVRKAKARVERARRQLAQRRAAQVEATGTRNLTDPDARFMPVPTGGFILGYNAQLAVSADHLILDYDPVQDPGDDRQLVPMFAHLQQTLLMLRAATGNPDLRIGYASADAGYASEANLAAPGPDRIIALGKRTNIAGEEPPTSPPGEDATATATMAWLLSTPEGRARYKKRGATVEPVNGHLKQARGLRRFARRGKTAARAELALAALANNLARLFTVQTAKTQTPATTTR
jgi:transposase